MKLKKFSADVSEWRNLILKGTTHIRVDLWGVRKNKFSCLFFITTLNLVQPKIFSRNHVASLGGWFVLGTSPVAEYYNVTLDVNAVVELLQEKQFSMFVKVKQCTCSRDDALLTTFLKSLSRLITLHLQFRNVPQTICALEGRHWLESLDRLMYRLTNLILRKGLPIRLLLGCYFLIITFFLDVCFCSFCVLLFHEWCVHMGCAD